MKQDSRNLILGIFSFIIAKLILVKIGIENVPIQITILVLILTNFVVIYGIRKTKVNRSLRKYYQILSVLFPTFTILAGISLIIVISYPYLINKYIVLLWICLIAGFSAFIAFGTVCILIIKKNNKLAK